MRTTAHWEVCKNQESYYAAHHFALQLEEVAKASNLSTHGIKVFSKKYTRTHGSIADALVNWDEGPDGWTQNIDVVNTSGVYAEVEDECTIAFYDI